MPADRRLADSHLTSPMSMHAVGPPPFPRTSHVIREAGGQARGFRRAPDHTGRTSMSPWTAEVPSPSLVVRGWDEQLRARGYRVTPQRQLVLEAVARLDHATPEEIGAQVQQTARGVNISTIYRTLELLEQIGMVTHTHLGHGAPTYHLASRRRPRAPGLPGLRPGHRDRPGRDPPADHRARRAARLRDRRRAPDRVRPLRRLPDATAECQLDGRARCWTWPGAVRGRAGRTRASPRTTATRCASSAR